MTTHEHSHISHRGEVIASSSSHGISLQELLATLRRGKWIIAATIGVTLLLVAVYTFVVSPVYEATAVVQIDSNVKTSVAPMLDFSSSGISSKITNEIEALRSVSMAEAVAQWLVDKRTTDGVHPHGIAIIAPSDSKDSNSSAAPLPLIVKRLMRSTDVTPVKESDIIKIVVRSNNADEAALIANTYTRMYVDRDLNESRKKSHILREFLQSQLSSKHDQLDSTEQALQSYMRRSGVVALDEEARQRVEQMADLEASRDALDVDIRSREQSLQSLQEQLALEEPNVARAMGESNDMYVKLLQEQIAKLEVQRDVGMAQSSRLNLDIAKNYREQLRDIELQIAQLKKNLRDRANALVGSLGPNSQGGENGGASGGFVASARQKIIEQKIELDGLKAKRKALSTIIADAERQFNKIPSKSIQLAKLQRARLSTEKLYLLVEEKYNEAAITETSEFGSVNIVDPATVPLDPVSPRPVLNMAIGLLLGIGFGISIVLIKASMDTHLRTPGDLKKMGLIPLAVIHRVDRSMLVKFNLKDPTTDGRPIDPRLIVRYNPFAPASESYKRLRGAILDITTKEPIRTIVVSSASPQEGKSTVVSNLAATYAGMEEKVLLIDADLHRPTIHKIFGILREPGLSEILTGEEEFEDVVHHGAIGNLDVLSCGKAAKDPSELFGSGRMKHLLAEVRTKYSLVLLDSPPLLAVADCGVLARLVDGIILVVQSGATTVEMLELASEFLNKQRHNVLGLVLNGFDAVRAYGSNRYAYKSGYANYGYSSEGTKQKAGHAVE